ncbi:BRCT domain-containing protein [Laribacter hongkongensis]|uniref:BRCT domain-containing protein n=1 Tax=Laribacter hongkongensis TaxID=168471 RepID=UPI001EFD7A4C|nr:BRCT domain-containing protein [Laribacter hongkongensis]MCG9083959.1 hypothetical protein [Laribacter hongkongensis]
MHIDHAPYHFLMGKYRLNKSIEYLAGLLEGISIDREINKKELSFINQWINEHIEFSDKHPFNEIIPVLHESIKDEILSEDEKDDLVWLCNKILENEYIDEITSDLRRLHAILGGILADGVITKDELKGLSSWMSDHEHLQRCWPYDEVASLIMSVMKDGKIDDHEHEMLRMFFSEFISVLDDKTITEPKAIINGSITGLCSACPEIIFTNSCFSFTGASSRYTRNELIDLVNTLGGAFSRSVSKKVDYLIIGADGNPCWSYACYGRKVEAAINLRKKGSKILLVHEHDFHDAVADIM